MLQYAYYIIIILWNIKCHTLSDAVFIVLEEEKTKTHLVKNRKNN